MDTLHKGDEDDGVIIIINIILPVIPSVLKYKIFSSKLTKVKC